ncbi:hypothetical protein CLOM_g4978 [Closterium sp. NIES-68]|nr:hypothetical protein CLOM_g4978 [Closterium sp. NIES-68]GJP61976.1 hypothetical protein CLOP_g19091 [Closterium sp. NIES-67]
MARLFQLVLAVFLAAGIATSDAKEVLSKFATSAVNAVCVGTSSLMADAMAASAPATADIPPSDAADIPPSDAADVCTNIKNAPSNSRYMYIGNRAELAAEHNCPERTDLRVFNSATSALSPETVLPAPVGSTGLVIATTTDNTSQRHCRGAGDSGESQELTSEANLPSTAEAMLGGYFNSVMNSLDVSPTPGPYATAGPLYGAILSDQASSSVAYVSFRIASLDDCPCAPRPDGCVCGQTCSCTVAGCWFDPQDVSTQWCALSDVYTTKMPGNKKDSVPVTSPSTTTSTNIGGTARRLLADLNPKPIFASLNFILSSGSANEEKHDADVKISEDSSATEFVQFGEEDSPLTWQQAEEHVEGPQVQEEQVEVEQLELGQVEEEKIDEEQVELEQAELEQVELIKNEELVLGQRATKSWRERVLAEQEIPKQPLTMEGVQRRRLSQICTYVNGVFKCYTQ